MSITVYTGVQGSGKSYEAVKNAVLSAIVLGRRVVTNISGLNQELCFELLVKRGHDKSKFGTIEVVTNERVLEPSFFPGEASSSRFKFDIPDWVPLRELQHYADEYILHQGKSFTRTAFQLLLPELNKLHDRGIDIGSCLVTAALKEWKTFEANWFFDKPVGEAFACLNDAGPAVVQPGDLVVIDEAWRYWADLQGKLPAEHMNFFRMHRHYVNSLGVSCDLLILIQDFQSLNRFIRGVCELVLSFSKLKSLGLMSRYKVTVYEGRPSKRTLVSTSPWQKYDKAIFPLYKSYDGNGGKELRIDDRQNLFKNKWFVGIMVVALIGSVWGSIWFVGYISKLRSGNNVAPAPQGIDTQNSSGNPSSISSNSNIGAVLSDEVRLVGVLERSTGESLVLLQAQDGRIYHQRMNSGVLDGWSTTTNFNGRKVAFQFGVGVKQ